MEKEKVYIGLLNKKSLATNESIYIRDLGQVYSKDSGLKKKVENTKVYSSKEEETWDYITGLNILGILLEKYPNIDIELYGADQVILEIKSKEKRNGLFQVLKLLFVCTTLFFGAALGIMYFHEDVNMIEAMESLYFAFTGEKKDNPLLMSVPYSLGLGIGMFTFFTRVKSSSKRRRMEPGPMDVELYLYDDDLEAYIKNELMENMDKIPKD